MSVWYDLGEVPADLGRTVVTVGNFDGVHKGHRVVIARARSVAATVGGLPVVAVTFDPHPMQVLLPERAPRRLTSIDHRCQLLNEAGAEHVLVLPFDRDMASWAPEEFIRRVLVGSLGARAVVVGENFRFGARAAGTTATLAETGARVGFEVTALELAGAAHPWSSSFVRRALAEGDVVEAARALGRDHSVRGAVVEGDKRGRELGFPTANVPTDGRTAVPLDGVYAGWLRRLDEADAPALPAAISVGTNPTFDGVQHRVESYVLDRTDLELYGVPVEVSFVERLRGQERYDGVEALVAQMRLDVDQARTILGVEAPDGLGRHGRR
jgi:riboflavin kinase/FMN adenylyltransferase